MDKYLFRGLGTLLALPIILGTLGCSGSAADGASQASTNPANSAGTAHTVATAGTGAKALAAVLHASFEPKGQAGMDRLKQDPTQKACSDSAPNLPPAALTAKLKKVNREMVEYPTDGKYLGNWKQGMAIANNGKGFQYSDDPSKPAGGNCYACHELDKQHVAFGNLGPSLYHYGKNRGYSKAAMKLTWSMLYDIKGYHLCAAMPRFGAKHILTQAQLKDVMALLYDPHSPVNQ